ncbi:Crp/Fnr family transcriptional regulator [Streptomyces sp. NPDC059805]|uniref:Crp/Fnr family transcriptional regulator n=1 Tax=Streptomyces sp. NPDC059805 TaxID=3346954 RepID=UPI00364F1DFC
MLNPPTDTEGSLRELHNELHRLYVRAGAPSVRQIAGALEPGRISHDTVHRALTKPTLPTWPTVEAIVRALHGDLAHFQYLWRQCALGTQTQERVTRSPVAFNPPVADTESEANRTDSTPSRPPRTGPPRTSQTWPGSVLSALKEETRRDILSTGTPRRFFQGDKLSWQGDRAQHVLVLLSGYCKETANTWQGTSALLDFFGPGDIYGEAQALTTDDTRPTDLLAVTDVHTRVIRASEFAELTTKYPDLQRAIISNISKRLSWANEARLNFALPARTRISRTLLSLAERHGVEHNGAISFDFRMTQPDLASLSGCAETTVHKFLREARARGIITTTYRSITILDTQTIHYMATESDGNW